MCLASSPAISENLSLSSLLMMLKTNNTKNYEKNEILTQLCLKSVLPFLPCIILLAVTPFCITYSRKKYDFFIYTIGIAAFIIFYVFMDAATVLGENHVLSPQVAIFTPFTIVTLFFSWNFARMSFYTLKKV